MKTFIQFTRFAVASLIALAASSQVSAFEGKIEMKMTSRGEGEMLMTMIVKGALLRTEMKPAQNSKRNKHGGDTFVVITNTETLETTTLMDSEKMYMVQKLPQPDAEQVQKDNAMEFKSTGRKETIAGVEAEEYVGTSKKQRVEVWVTKELGKFMMANPGGPMGGGKRKADAWQAFTEKENFFPLRSITRTKEGAPEDSRMEVTAIDKSKQPDSLFVPPADYKKFEMPDMGSMMKGMIPGR